MIVVDASAILAYLFQEKGSEIVGPLLSEAFINSLNFSEVVGRFVRDGHSAETVANKLSSAITVIPFSLQHSIQAAKLLPFTKKYGLSLADRACLALAIEMNIPVWTADKVWLEVGLDLEINSIR